MKNVFFLWYVFLVIQSSLVAQTKLSKTAERKTHIGLCIMATGRYDQFVEPLINSARKFFLTNKRVTYFVFTDGTIPTSSDIVRIQQKRLGWPHDTMMRNSVYLQTRKHFDGVDYLFALDADMLFVDSVGEEMLGHLVGTQHPGYFNKPGTYETNYRSTAFVPQKRRKIYYAGGFFGGKKEAFLQLCEITTKNIQNDLAKGIIAIWHDESHLNRYFAFNPPEKTLSPSYCYPEGWNIPFQPRLIALNKNHSALRKYLSKIPKNTFSGGKLCCPTSP